MLSGILLAFAAVVAAPQQDADAAFLKQFDRAIELADRVNQDRAVQKYRRAAFDAYMAKAERAKWDDEWIQAFAASWKRVFRSDFPEIYSKYLTDLSPELSSKRSDAIYRLSQLYDVNRQAISSRDPADWQKMIEGIEAGGILLDLMEAGDKYYQGISQMFLAYAYNTAYRDGGGDDFQALKATENYLKLRKELDLTNDPDFQNMEKLLGELQARLGIEVEKEEREVKESPFTIQPLEGAEWIEVPLEAGSIKKPGSMQFPSDIADLDSRHWLTIAIGGEGERFPITPAYGGDDVMFAGPGGPVQVERLRGNKFVIHAGDEPSEEFTLKSKPTLVEFTQKLADGAVVPRAILVAGGAEQDQFQGLQVNTGMSELGGVIFYRSVAIRTGETPFGDLVLYDCDSDGQFGRFPARVAGSAAMPTDVYYNRFDAMTLGKMKQALPFSRWISDGKTWYEIEWPEHPGKAEMVRIREAGPNLGTLQVKFKGPKGLDLVSLILRHETKKNEGLYIDVSGKSPFEVPIGRYVVVQGMLRGDDGEECIIQPPSDIPFSVIVDQGDPAVLEFGKPFTIVAEPVIEGNEVRIDPESFRVVGVAGETYMQHLYAPFDEIEVEVKGGKKFLMTQAEPEAVAGNWHAAYFPVSESAELPKSGEAIVRLTVKKHPWFGKLQSEWIGED
ncbi:MAG: hypothetical protein CMJ94_02425 [Planctomycetes bacterium]|nr:hypothetical protein [Planctomycetota bacterium]